MNTMTLANVILHGSREELINALQTKPDVNLLDEYGYTPLIECVIQNDLEKAKLIVGAGADINQADLTGRTALHWAVSNSNALLAEWLLSMKANPNAHNLSGEPVLVKPLLQNEVRLKLALVNQGASFQFAYDYIHAKLLGHRYELIGSVDIASPDDIFIEVDYEGFYLDASLRLIAFSLKNFRENYEARYIEPWFDDIDAIILALKKSCELLQFDHYLTNYRDYSSKILSLLSADTLILPMSQEGHAFTIIKSGSLLAICDRAFLGNELENQSGIEVFYINRPLGFKPSLVMPLVFEKQHIKHIKRILKKELLLKPIATIDMPRQRIGNCSWANVEAIIPVLFFMLQMNAKNQSNTQARIIIDSIELFQRWQLWEKERALHFFLDQLGNASRSRKASIAALLAGLMFQTCSAENPNDIARAKKIIGQLKKYQLDFVFDTYIEYYRKKNPTAAGRNLEKLLEIYKREEAL